MKKTLIFFIILIMTALSSFAQSRDDTRIFISPVTSDLPGHARFFEDQFEMETTAAGYAVTDNAKDSDYVLNLEARNNMVVYDDGSEEVDEEKQFILQISLVRREDNVEIVAFGFPYNDLEEMYDFDLYLLYQAMANVPLSKLGEALPDDDRWRNKWIYLRASFDYPIPFYLLKDDGLIAGAALWMTDEPKPGEARFYQIPDLLINPRPAATIGVELQYLNWMSTELNFQLKFGDPLTASAFIPVIQLQQKFPIKPSKHFMIEPYGAIAFPMDTSENVTVPSIAAGGGVQLGVKGGERGAFFVDVNAIFALGDVIEKNTNTKYDHPSELHYVNFSVGLGFGYKIGFFDRQRPEPKQ